MSNHHHYTSAFTDRESQVAELLAAGYTDKQIGTALGLSRQRISQIVARIAYKLRIDRLSNVRASIAQRVA